MSLPRCTHIRNQRRLSRWHRHDRNSIKVFATSLFCLLNVNIIWMVYNMQYTCNHFTDLTNVCNFYTCCIDCSILFKHDNSLIHFLAYLDGFGWKMDELVRLIGGKYMVCKSSVNCIYFGSVVKPFIDAADMSGLKTCGVGLCRWTGRPADL